MEKRTTCIPDFMNQRNAPVLDGTTGSAIKKIRLQNDHLDGTTGSAIKKIRLQNDHLEYDEESPWTFYEPFMCLNARIPGNTAMGMVFLAKRRLCKEQKEKIFIVKREPEKCYEEGQIKRLLMARHDNLQSVRGVYAHNGDTYFVLDDVEVTLEHLLATAQPFIESQVAYVGKQVCSCSLRTRSLN
jgi:hypothetical protein